jgi:hypothetical protein
VVGQEYFFSVLKKEISYPTSAGQTNAVFLLGTDYTDLMLALIDLARGKYDDHRMINEKGALIEYGRLGPQWLDHLESLSRRQVIGFLCQQPAIISTCPSSSKSALDSPDSPTHIHTCGLSWHLGMTRLFPSAIPFPSPPSFPKRACACCTRHTYQYEVLTHRLLSTQSLDTNGTNKTNTANDTSSRTDASSVISRPQTSCPRPPSPISTRPPPPDTPPCPQAPPCRERCRARRFSHPDGRVPRGGWGWETHAPGRSVWQFYPPLLLFVCTLKAT